MKTFTVVRLKTNGLSIHNVWTRSKQEAWDLCRPDDSKLIGKLVTGQKIAFSASNHFPFNSLQFLHWR